MGALAQAVSDRLSFYEGAPRVKAPAADFGFTVFSSFSFLLQVAFALVGPVHS